MRQPSADAISRNSRHVERVMEHRFLGELLAEAWRHEQQLLEVLRPEVDASGYDLVIGHGGFLRPVQLKTRGYSSATTSYPIQRNLARYRGACVVVLDYEKETFALKSAGFFGNREDPAGFMPPLDAYPNAQNPNTGKERSGSCELPDRDVQRLTIPELLVALFPSFAPAVAQAAAVTKELNERIAAGLAARRFEVCCCHSHSIWRPHQVETLHVRMFEALLDAVSGPAGAIASTIIANEVVVGTNVRLRRNSDIQLSWSGISLNGSKESPLRITIQLEP